MRENKNRIIKILMKVNNIILIIISIIYLIDYEEELLNWFSKQLLYKTNLDSHKYLTEANLYVSVLLFWLIILVIGIMLYDNKENLLSTEYEASQNTEKINEDVLIIIPAYNEEKSLQKAILEIKSIAKVLVVDDGSKDNTKDIAIKHADYVISHYNNFGLSQAIKSGIDFALKKKFKYIGIFDADLQYRRADLASLINLIKKRTEYDLVLGSRLYGKIEEMPITKKIGNILFSKTISLLTGVSISDSQTGLRVFTNNFASTIRLRRGFTYTQQMIIEAGYWKFKIAEIPIVFEKRYDGNSRLMKNAIDFAIKAWTLNIKIFTYLYPIKLLFMTLILNTIIVNLLKLTHIKNSIDLINIYILLLTLSIMIFIALYFNILILENDDLKDKKYYQILKQ